MARSMPPSPCPVVRGLTARSGGCHTPHCPSEEPEEHIAAIMGERQICARTLSGCIPCPSIPFNQGVRCRGAPGAGGVVGEIVWRRGLPVLHDGVDEGPGLVDPIRAGKE